MKPNILFVFPDQHRWDWLPTTGPVEMKYLRSLMDRGTTFTQAITNSPLCAPARACLAQGREYENCGVYNNNFCTPPEVPTFYRALRAGGYQVGGVGKFDLHKPLMYWGEKGWLPQLGELGFSEAMDHEGKWDAFWASENPPRGPYGQYLSDRGLLEIYWEDFLRRYYDQMDTRPTGLPEDAYADNWETDAALAMLGRFAEKKSPWFAMVNFSGPHDPWDITEEMEKGVRDREMPLPPGQKDPDGRIRAVRRNYAGMLENIDRNLGRLLAFLEETNQLEHTVILYASDHGEMLGDRGRFYKSVPFEPSVRIPMVLSGPGILPGRRCDALVQLNDLAATIAEIAGVSFDGAGESRSLLPLASRENAPPVREYQHSALFVSLPQTKGSFSGYENLRAHGKDMHGKEDIDSFNRRLGHPCRGTPEQKKEKKRDWRCVRTERYKLVEYFCPSEYALYDLMLDPREEKNLAPENPNLVWELKQAMLPLPEEMTGVQEPEKGRTL